MSRILSFVTVALVSLNFNAQEKNLIADTTLKGNIKQISQFDFNRRSPEEIQRVTTVLYNEQNQPVEIYVGQSDKKRLTEKMIYDSNGQLIEKFHFNYQEDTTTATTYEYGPHGITKEFTQYKGSFKPKGHIYSYSEKGLLIKDQEFKIYEGKEIPIDRYTIEYTYYEDGKPHQILSGMKTKTFSGDTITIIDHTRGDKKTQLILNDKGQKIKEITYDDKASVEGVIEVEAPGENEEISVDINDQFPKKKSPEDLVIASTTDYSYNDKGHLIKYVYNSNRKYEPAGKSFYEYEYDEKGNIISYKEFSMVSGTNKLKTFFKREIVYY